MLEGSDTAGKFVYTRSERARTTLRRLALIAVLGVLLGFVMQALVIAARLLGGGAFPGLTVVADLVQTVTWSVLVCTGVAIGVSVGKARKALAGIIAFFLAPLSLVVAKAGQKAMLSIIGALEQPAVLSLATIGLVRAFEYGLLAWLLTRLTERDIVRPVLYIAIGAVIGLSFGAVLFWLSYTAALAAGSQMTTPQILGLLVNEVGSPAGCAFLIYIGQLASYSFTVYEKNQPTASPPAGS